jgi:hypothetical protein
LELQEVGCPWLKILLRGVLWVLGKLFRQLCTNNRCTVIRNPGDGGPWVKIILRGIFGVARKSRGVPYFHVLLHFHEKVLKTLVWRQ